MNENLITEFTDGSRIFFSKGKFDEWCVYLADNFSKPISPTDTQYFHGLNKLRTQKSANSIYEDFILLYEKTNQIIEIDTLKLISNISATYGELSLYANKLFVTLYATMISEMNKENTKLGKRIKRLGVHKVLIEDYPVNSAANFMRGMKWQEIDNLCAERGF